MNTKLDVQFEWPSELLGSKHSRGFIPKLHFQRFELKYLIPQDEIDRVRAHVAAFMEPDPALESGSRTYEVHSLYFDSPLRYYYFQKRDGVRKRKKIRLRTYRTSGAFSESFFEIKRKDDAVVHKDRFVFPRSRYERFLESGAIAALFDGPVPDERLAREYEEERLLRSLYPNTLVVYTREPLLGRFNKNVRITFDSNIRAHASESLYYAGDDFVDVFGDVTVMEVKFSSSLPFYVADAIKRFSLSARPYSKYCQAVEACDKIHCHTPVINNFRTRL